MTANNNLPQKAIISVAWPYANGDLHLGHPAGYLLGASILNKFFRLNGVDVLMVSGSDMFGTPSAVKAWKEGVDPREYTAKQHLRHLQVMKELDMNFSLYTSTATKLHEVVVQAIFKALHDGGFITKSKIEQFWSEKEHKFLLDRYIEGKCPNCGFEKARGDQCDNCQKALTPDELINPYSIFGDKTLSKRKSTNYFLDLAKLQPLLEKFYKNHKYFQDWRKHVQATTEAWLKEGLLPRAITRDMEDFGVALPTGYEIEGEAGKVIYVWFEAVSGYITASVEAEVRTTKKTPSVAKLLGINLSDEEWVALLPTESTVNYDVYPKQSLKWSDYWQDANTRSYYFMGKDNIFFHTIIWPGMLLGLSDKLGTDLNEPWNVPANQYLNLGGAKFSKSTGNFIETNSFINEFGKNATRYYLASRMPENKDYDFTWDEFIAANNNELAANLGNFVNRTLTFYSKNTDILDVVAAKSDEAVLAEIKQTYEIVSDKLNNQKFVEALQKIMELSAYGNKFFNDSTVWHTIKTDTTLASEKMGALLSIVINLPTLLEPFLPQLAAGIREQLGLELPQVEAGKSYWQPLQLKTTTLSLGTIAPLVKQLELTAKEDANNTK